MADVLVQAEFLRRAPQGNFVQNFPPWSMPNLATLWLMLWSCSAAEKVAFFTYREFYIAVKTDFFLDTDLLSVQTR